MRFILPILVALTGLANGLEKGKVAAPNWSQVYTVTGVLTIPYAEIEEPFFAWFDGPSKQSRIDYYGDMVKTYQLGGTGSFGTSIKVAPVTTESEQNTNTCLQVNGTSDNKIQPQAMLPSLLGFECVGEEVINSILTEKWQLSETIGQKVNKYTMWMYYEADPNNATDKLAVPVRYEMRGYNSLLGSHYDHYFLTYSMFDVDAIPEETFKISKNLSCSSFPGPGDRHIYTFNPMAEFIRPETTSHVDFEFKKFLKKHNKKYATKKEHSLRQSAFLQNIRFIHSTNRQNKGFTLAVNHLTDKSPEEMKALRGRVYSGKYNGGAEFPHKKNEVTDLPESWDWRLFGAVTPVKDQSVCGSCWSFGTIGAIEGAYFLKTHNLVRLSQQALIDCSWGYGNNGCDGGEDFRAYQWMQKHGGIPTEEDYGPYLGQDGYCHADSVPKVATITGWVNVTSNDINAMKLALKMHGPISVAIDASHRAFSFYSNGVYYDKDCGNKEDQLDHAVLAVGYGKMNGQDYWLVKNSWSNYWGNDGYVLMSAKDNNCGVMTTPTYVTM